MIDERSLRDAFGSFGTGVAIATLAQDGVAFGMTINSLASVSLAPPLLSWCLGHGSDMTARFASAPCFGISVLAAAQKDLSVRLAQAGQHVLAQGDYVLGENGIPRIATPLAHFDCRVQQKITAGDHILFIGAVEAATSYDDERAPLLFYRGDYSALAVE